MSSRRAAPYAVALTASAVLGYFAVGAILREAGRPSLPLDDAFIHFQYARRFAEGAPFRYTGDAVSTGTTSLVWPVLLAPFWKAGARGLSLVWVAWALGTLAHAGVAVETARLARRLTSDACALAAGAMCLAFGPFAWFAWSGMETMAFAWVLVRTTRLAAEALDREPSPRFAQLAALGFLAPLVRPEGLFASLVAAAALALRAERAGSPWWRRRALALVPIAGPLVLPALFLAMTGDGAGNTARVKWLFYNPYYDGGRLVAQIGHHAWVLASDVLDGGEWTWIFVPRGLAFAFLLGAIALVRARARAPWTAALTLALALSVLATCSYQTFLWNRVRYAWPMMPAGFVLCAVLAHEIGRLLARARAPLEMVGPALAAALAARLAAMLPSAIEDLAQSARAVSEQQIALAEWTARTLPQGALVGVNDTGAIAYLGERRTFDIVGLTTAGEGATWLAGAGSRFERYERLPRAELPTHFIVYPEWLGCPELLGPELSRATVLDHAILGGDTMSVHLADYRLLGSGALPAAEPSGARLVDEVDVADLESEAAHGFVVGRTWETENIVGPISPDDLDAPDAAAPPDPRDVLDGGRVLRSRDTFHVTVPDSASGVALAMRVAAREPVMLRVFCGGDEVGSVTVPRAPWAELTVTLPPAVVGRARIDVVAFKNDGSSALSNDDARFASFHYWLYAR